MIKFFKIKVKIGCNVLATGFTGGFVSYHRPNAKAKLDSVFLRHTHKKKWIRCCKNRGRACIRWYYQRLGDM